MSARRGIGTRLTEALIGKIAEFKEIGYKLGRWVDVGYRELLL